MHRFNKESFTWDGVDTLVYKEDNSPFKDVTRQVLFDGAFDLPVQLRYFEVGPGGYSTLEHHEHTHVVMIFRGSGTCLLGDTVYELKVGDTLVIPSHQFHQFRASHGEPFGFLCLVNQVRDKVQLPTESEWEALRALPAVAAFLSGK